ncbi:MAG: DNA primase catalytic subunit PriS [Candidatus Bilamarchaeaceae archaeon]
MNEPEKKFILDNFSEYYRRAEISVPSIEQREFGVGGFQKKIEARHMSFPNNQALKNYLIDNAPLFISHSIAYYRYPEATPMENKGWEGGDLVFDLDVHAGMFMKKEEIAKVRGDAIILIERLQEDFGVRKGEITVVFSGGRGFHIHVRSPEYRMLGGDERREISDYLGGVGLDYRKFFQKIDRYRLAGPKRADWGYRGRLCGLVEKTLRERPQLIHGRLKKADEAAKLWSCMDDGNWSKTTISDIVERLEKVAESLKLGTINVDAGVTIDTKRLIRVPNTLHGSTGLAAKIIERLDDFSPYNDAVAFGDEPVKVRALLDMPEQEFSNKGMERIKKGEERETPKSYAMYLILKGAAVISSQEASR